MNTKLLAALYIWAYLSIPARAYAPLGRDK